MVCTPLHAISWSDFLALCTTYKNQFFSSIVQQPAPVLVAHSLVSALAIGVLAYSISNVRMRRFVNQRAQWLATHGPQQNAAQDSAAWITVKMSDDNQEQEEVRMPLSALIFGEDTDLCIGKTREELRSFRTSNGYVQLPFARNIVTLNGLVASVVESNNVMQQNLNDLQEVILELRKRFTTQEATIAALQKKLDTQMAVNDSLEKSVSNAQQLARQASANALRLGSGL